ncbi:putative nucleotidase [Podospora australis]|uniref:Nucleotidase n=1 Tax=Podospora australis TaxID=1536484 RepID=A0AAN6WQ84_9PEZI|nr:putative nucleotidase [Podospora australis]
MSVSEDLKDDDFSIIERLADAIRIEDKVHHNTEDRQRLVQDLFEGPRKCQCCVNWVHEKPVEVEVVPVAPEPEDTTHPLIIRHRVLPTAVKGKTRLEIHSIEIRHPEVREVLYKVFKGFDHIVPKVRYLVFRAPFRQFFWRWDKFEAAIAEQDNEVIKEILVQLRSIVRTELAEAFAVSEELTSHGIINFKYLWTIFPPGELVYETADRSISGQFHIVTSISTPEQEHSHRYGINCLYTDWNASYFGSRSIKLDVNGFFGTRKIEHLSVKPAKYLSDLEETRQKCLARGRKFCEYKGLHYKAYRAADEGDRDDGADSKSKTTRIMLDTVGHPQRPRYGLAPLVDLKRLPCYTSLISQAPVEQEPPGGHLPLEEDENPEGGRGFPNDGTRRRTAPMHPRPSRYPPPPPAPASDFEPSPPRGPVIRRPRASRRIRVADSDSDSSSESDDDDTEGELTELQLLICSSSVLGYDFKDKAWRNFDVERIVDIEENPEPFDSLVLPDGYKDLILSFVENQLKDGEQFDDVINGKGGGLVMLLAGSSGVGKTLTAESVAEKMKAPLVKIDLEPFMKDQSTRSNDRDYESDDEANQDDLGAVFSRAARWNAVLLIDECDMYLGKRSSEDAHSERNKLVARFLRELEYYPSLLFLTTNRETALDPAIYSRIHLTINYPALDEKSRMAIWKTFLERGDSECTVTAEELKILSEVETNGRRIKNITKTAKMMARRKGRGICFDDLRHVLRITEGLTIDAPPAADP